MQTILFFRNKCVESERCHRKRSGGHGLRQFHRSPHGGGYSDIAASGLASFTGMSYSGLNQWPKQTKLQTTGIKLHFRLHA